MILVYAFCSPLALLSHHCYDASATFSSLSVN